MQPDLTHLFLTFHCCQPTGCTDRKDERQRDLNPGGYLPQQ